MENIKKTIEEDFETANQLVEVKQFPISLSILDEKGRAIILTSNENTLDELIEKAHVIRYNFFSYPDTKDKPLGVS